MLISWSRRATSASSAKIKDRSGLTVYTTDISSGYFVAEFIGLKKVYTFSSKGDYSIPKKV